ADFQVALQPMHAAAFVPLVGQKARVRTRPLATSTQRDEVEIANVNPGTNTLTIPDTSGTLAAAVAAGTFGAGSILFVAKRAAAAPNAELSLVAPRIAAHISTSNNPLNVA